jgi:hypothetical protein
MGLLISQSMIESHGGRLRALLLRAGGHPLEAFEFL